MFSPPILFFFVSSLTRINGNPLHLPGRYNSTVVASDGAELDALDGPPLAPSHARRPDPFVLEDEEQLPLLVPDKIYSALAFIHVYKTSGSTYGAALAEWARYHNLPMFSDMRDVWTESMW